MQPSASDTTGKLADPAAASTLPPQTGQTIGDLLSAKGLSWAWYAGSWNTASSDRTVIYNNKVPNLQSHHQPFNYYAAFDPVAHPDARAAHLKDFDSDFLKDVAAGTLPAVSFYKPQGNLNQHPGYASVADGDAHIADVLAKLQASPQWKNMLVVVTYDENGGFYDHATVPKGDRWGPGTRIPALIVSPFAKKGFVDKTQYDTGSTLRFITHRWSLPGAEIFTNNKATELALPLVEANVPFKIHIVKDRDMKERLCLEVERLRLSAMIMGSRGFGANDIRGIISKGKLGSVSDYCVKNCICPVVVVRYPQEDEYGDGAVEKKRRLRLNCHRYRRRSTSIMMPMS
ncbi:universal stress protein A-like protein [Solanum tuberosum]|uniref:Anti-bacterial protein n=1 Tax=Solanum tuberosum TaxID=4113 RepID=Q6WBY1_SOLTU|nr:universal stress protein A-like protein [Solanum tuberosum]AAQ57264.1 anti-bacterial protein [Solanum tuberosum]